MGPLWALTPTLAAGVSAQSFAVVLSGITATVLGAWALIQGGKGSKALAVSNSNTTLWKQTNDLVDQLQEENKRLADANLRCETRACEAKAAADLAMNELALLKRDHLRLQLKVEQKLGEAWDD